MTSVGVNSSTGIAGEISEFQIRVTEGTEVGYETRFFVFLSVFLCAAPVSILVQLLQLYFLSGLILSNFSLPLFLFSFPHLKLFVGPGSILFGSLWGHFELPWNLLRGFKAMLDILPAHLLACMQ